jgi:hypothetical protein
LRTIERPHAAQGEVTKFAVRADPRYRKAMAKASRIDFDAPTPVDEEKDDETFAAIDEGNL